MREIDIVISRLELRIMIEPIWCFLHHSRRNSSGLQPGHQLITFFATGCDIQTPVQFVLVGFTSAHVDKPIIERPLGRTQSLPQAMPLVVGLDRNGYPIVVAAAA